FEELLATDEKISFTEKVEANEMINQLHDQCKNIQAKIRPYIAAVTDESLLEELLTLNDNLSNAFQKYEKIYNNHEIFQNPKPITSVADITTESNDDDHDNIITTIETSPITIVTSPTSPSVTSPTFSIGDSDDDGDFDNIALSEGSLSSKKIPPSLKIESLLASDIDIHSQKSPKSPLEEMNKLLEVEEGQVLRKAREVFEQDIEETESSPLDQLSGEELKLQASIKSLLSLEKFELSMIQILNLNSL
ncbi:6467_t:CDS:2, partial [Funneliformis mosseae]